MTKITVIGSGNIGFATAAHLTYLGHDVCFCGSKLSKKIKIKGCINKAIEISEVTSDKKDAVKNAKYIIITITSLYQANVIKEFAQDLSNESIIILCPGKFGGSLYIEKIIKEINPDFRGSVVETTPPYAARIEDKNTINISGIKNKIRFSSTTDEKTKMITPEIQSIFPMMISAESWLERTFHEIGWLLHAPTFLFNINRIEKNEKFLFYADGITPQISKIIVALDQERMNLAKVVNVDCVSLKDVIREYYGTIGNNTYEAIHNNIPYKSIKAPESLEHRYIFEEISEYCIPLYELSVLMKIDMPMLKSIIDLSTVITKYDFYKNGRHLNQILDKADYFNGDKETKLFI
jgi:opine dehydrogenase